MKAALLRITIFICSLLPVTLRKWMNICLLGGAARRKPDNALRELFACEDEVMQLINLVAMKYEGGIHPKHRLMDYHRFFIQRLTPGDRVLDIGCGYGAVAFSLANAGMIVTGMDMEDRSIQEARRRYHHPNLTFVAGDVTQTLPQGAFDVVIMSNVLEHLEHRVEFLKTVQERINPRRWLIRVPMINRHWTVYMRRELGLQHYSDLTHFVEYTMETFGEEMRSAGLAITYCEIIWGEIYAEVFRA